MAEPPNRADNQAHDIERDRKPDSGGDPALRCGSNVALATQQRTAEEMTRLQRAILDSANYTIISTDPDGVIQTFNAAAERLLGYRADEVVGKVTPALIHDAGEIAKRAAELTRELGIAVDPGFEVFVARARRGQTDEKEWTYVCKDGRRFPVLLSVTALRDEAGRIDGFLGIGSDISERRRAEAERRHASIALRRSEEHLRSACRAARMGVWHVELRTNRITWSRELEELYGLAPGAFDGSAATFLAMVHADDREDTVRAIKQMPETSAPFTHEARIVKPDGTVIRTLSISHVEYGPDGQPAHLIGLVRDITAEKEAEDALRNQAAMLDLAFASILVRDLDDRIVMWNREAEKRYGWSRQEALGQEVHTLLRTEWPGPLPEIEAELLSRGQWAGELVHYTRSGDRIIDSSRWPLQTDAAGKPLAILEVNNDVTAQKQAEAALAERAQLSELAGEVGIALTQGGSLRQTLQRCAESLVRHLGAALARIWTLSDRKGMLKLQASAGMYTHLDGPHGRIPVGQYKIGRIAQMRQPHLTNQVIGDPEIGDQEWARREGMVAFAGHPLIVEGRVVGVMAMFARRPLSDATLTALAAIADGVGLGIERKHGEEALRESERFARSTVDALSAHIAILDEQGTIIGVNRAWQDFARANDAKLQAVGEGANYLAACDGGSTEGAAMAAGIQAVMRGERTEFAIEYPCHSPGERRWFVGRVTHFPGDGPVRVVVAHENITARKLAEEELQRAKEMADNASRAKSEFLANMSHEIRTPMNGILGMTELLLDMNLAGDQREFLDIIKSSADSLLSIINDVLDFSKIEAGKLELDPVEFRLRDSLCDMLKPLALRAHKKGVELTYRVAPQVPDALRGDWNRVRQVLINLVGNAIKFTHQGETAVDVEADAVDESMAVLHVTVRDTGIGIASEKLEAVFAPFVQADGTMTRQYGGTGLGLAICSRLIEMMGGRIWAESELGKGSIFHFTAKLEVSSSPAVDPMAPPPERLHGLTVLVVDDNETNRRILQELLVRWGMRPTLVDGGRAALTALAAASDRGESFQLVLLDTSMPEMDGLTLVERIKADSMLAGITILMLSSADRQEDVRRCRDLGVGAYLTKPVKASELLESIQKIMCARAPTAEPRTALETGLQEAASPALHSMAILLVEDNLFNQRVAVAMLERQGHRVRVAENGLEALALLAKESFQLVLMDVQMPKMDGLEATAAIRSNECGTGRHIPIIALTAHAMKGDRERFLAAGMDGYVTKPLRPEELWQAIRQVLPGAAVLPGEPADASADLSSGKPVTVLVAAPAVDLKSALARLGGKIELLREITGLFRGQCAKLMDQIGDAVRLGDAKKLQCAAHTLKGSVSFFGAPAAKEAAAQLETMGQEGKLERSREVLARLIEEVNRLLEELKSVDAS